MNFNNLRLRLFSNSLTGANFAWYTVLTNNLVFNWSEVERKFHTQFYKVELEIIVDELSKLTLVEEVVTGKYGEHHDFYS